MKSQQTKELAALSFIFEMVSEVNGNPKIFLTAKRKQCHLALFKKQCTLDRILDTSIQGQKIFWFSM